MNGTHTASYLYCVDTLLFRAETVDLVYRHLSTFRLSQEDNTFVSHLIKTSLAKVTDQETGAPCVCVCLHVCVFSILGPTTLIKMC